MNSQRIYDELIEHRQQNPLEKNGSGCTENHHIIPKCMGGGDNKENLVRLTAREHFVAHWLLWKIYKNTEYGNKMALAFKCMIDIRKNVVGSRKFAEVREAAAAATSERMSGENHPMFGWTGENNPMYNKKHTEEARQKISAAKKGKKCKPCTAETKQKISAANSGKNNPMYGRTGENHPNSKLSNVARQEIRDLYSTGCWSQRKLAKKFGVSQAAIYKILKQK